MMAGIRGRDTKPELALRAALRSLGLVGYRCHYAKAMGCPDVCFVRARLAVFVDGAFWHGHPDHFTPGKSGPKWDAKIRRNIERDREVDTGLRRQGWTVVRVWDFEVENDAMGAARVIADVMSRPANPV